MSMFGRLFRRKAVIQTTQASSPIVSKASSAQVTPPPVEAPALKVKRESSQIASHFGLSRSGTKWIYSGRGSAQFAKDICDAEICSGILKSEKQKGVSQVCFVLGNPPLMILRQPDGPFCFATSMSSSEIAKIAVALSTIEGTQTAVIMQLDDLWIINL